MYVPLQRSLVYVQLQWYTVYVPLQWCTLQSSYSREQPSQALPPSRAAEKVRSLCRVPTPQEALQVVHAPQPSHSQSRLHGSDVHVIAPSVHVL